MGRRAALEAIGKEGDSMTGSHHRNGCAWGALIAMLAIAGCASSPHPAVAPKVATAAATATLPAGCAQATAAVTAAREQLNAQDYSGAATRIADLRDTLPHGKLQIDAALAAPKLAFLNLDATQGNPVYQDIKDALASLDALDADCGS